MHGLSIFFPGNANPLVRSFWLWINWNER